MRLIDADAFIRFIKDVSKRQKYGEVLIDKNMTVEDVLNAVVASLENKGLAEGDTPTIVSEDRVIRYMERGNRTRLIDADTYLKKVCTYKETGCGSCRLQTICPVDEPTIDAIPVKYIIEYLNKGGEDKISECLKEWKENG